MSAVIYVSIPTLPAGHASIALCWRSASAGAGRTTSRSIAFTLTKGTAVLTLIGLPKWMNSQGQRRVVHKLDRLARDVYLSEGIHREIEKCRARVHAVRGAVENTLRARWCKRYSMPQQSTSGESSRPVFCSHAAPPT